VNSRDNRPRNPSLFLSLLGFEVKLGPSFFPYPITPYTPAEDHHLDTSCNLDSYKVKQVKQANKKQSIPALLLASQKVLISREIINIWNTSRKLKPKWVRQFCRHHVNKNRNNYTLNLSTNRRLWQYIILSLSARSNVMSKRIWRSFQVVTRNKLVI